MTLKALALAILQLPELQQDCLAVTESTYNHAQTIPGTEKLILGVMVNSFGVPVIVTNI